jgi:hypothetical protein
LTKAYLKKNPSERYKSAEKWKKCWELFADDFCSNNLSIGCFDIDNQWELVGTSISRDLTFTP